MTTICFDFGNTRLKYAVFVDGAFTEESALENGNLAEIEQLLNKYNPDKTILSSVIEHDSNIENVLKDKTSFHKLNIDSKLPITSPVGKPHTIGADRLAIAVAAVDLYPNQHNLVISLGTCITYNFINKYHELVGGSISPGMDMRFKALQHFTAKLPHVEPDWNFPLIGYDTKTNILSGVLQGMACEIDGIIDSYKEKFNKFNAHLTGGNTAFFGPLLKNKIFADSKLIYKGLYAISEYNNDEPTT